LDNIEFQSLEKVMKDMLSTSLNALFMKRKNRFGFLDIWILALIFSSFSLVSSANAEDITWEGSGLETFIMEVSGNPISFSVFAPDANSSGNTVRVTGGPDVNGVVVGGISQGSDADASSNKVIITDGVVNGSQFAGVAGAVVDGDGNASANSVTISGGTVKLNIYGALAHGAGDAIKNSVNILGGTIGPSSLMGGWSDDGNVVDNVITITGGTVTTPGITGGYAQEDGYAVGNAVNISGGQVTLQNQYSSIRGGLSEGAGNVTGNKVAISDGTITATGANASIFGGDTEGNDAIGNSVSISGGTLNLSGASASIFGGSSEDGNAIGNNVSISGGTLNLSGAFASISGGSSENGDAIGNSVSISGGTVIGNVYGGISELGSAVKNTVTISGSPDLSAAALHGGGDNGGMPVDLFSGNTLNVREYTGGTVGEISNFEFYDFILPNALPNNATLMAVNGTAYLGDQSGRGSNVTEISTMGGNAPLTAGYRLSLFTATAVDASDFTQTSATGQHGVSLVYDWQLDTDAQNLFATVKNVRANPRAKAIPAGRAAAQAFLNQGQDLLVNAGFSAADGQLDREASGWSNPGIFTAFGGGHGRYETGSHVDVNGVSTLLGMGWRNNSPCGSLLLGAFFEAGWAEFDTRNAFPGSDPVHGDGDGRYYGGGLMARYDWQSGFYAETSGRVGGSRTKIHTDLLDPMGNLANYSLNTPYYGAHAGIGYKRDLSERVLVDVSAKYFWTRQHSDSAVVAGDPVKFDAIDSHRLRTGARFAFAVNECLGTYVGAAFEYEFNGKSRAGAYGFTYAVPTLKGGTGIGEIGVTVRKNSFSADLGVQGYAGRREGVTGNLRLAWVF
jgi:hypothetical protein